ncbi:MAG: hypothetical protein LKF48_09155 [Prevotella sp.]|nr:hypothetical protein [Prevotella sp.]MCH4183308.1 hypothetical protein [Prevotella sp.]MCH4242096.1 hypothetical protein [Prevotella sp.]
MVYQNGALWGSEIVHYGIPKWCIMVSAQTHLKISVTPFTKFSGSVPVRNAFYQSTFHSVIGTRTCVPLMSTLHKQDTTGG